MFSVGLREVGRKFLCTHFTVPKRVFVGIDKRENLCCLPADSGSAVGKSSLSADWSRISLWTYTTSHLFRQPALGQNREECKPSAVLCSAFGGREGEHTGANILSVAHYSLQGQWEEAFN